MNIIYTRADLSKNIYHTTDAEAEALLTKESHGHKIKCSLRPKTRAPVCLTPKAMLLEFLERLLNVSDSQ